MPNNKTLKIKISNNGKNVFTKKLLFADTDRGKWIERKFTIPYYSGANQIEITFEGNAGIAIDWIEIKE